VRQYCGISFALLPQSIAFPAERPDDRISHVGQVIPAETTVEFVINGDCGIEFALLRQGQSLVEECRIGLTPASPGLRLQW
jgi:hypothetical protein